MTDQSGFAALEPEDAARRDENAGITGLLALAASPQPESVGLPWAVGGFGVPIHPDLVERLIAIASAAELEARFLYGVPVVLTGDGVIVAAAFGMREIRVRLAADQIAPVLLASPREDPDLGGGWARVAAWPVEVPGAEIVPAVAAVLRVAAQTVSPTRAKRRTAPPSTLRTTPHPAPGASSRTPRSDRS